MASEIRLGIADAAKAHDAARAEDDAELRTLDMRERGKLIESACEVAAAVYRSRLAAGLPEVDPAPLPASTWEFLRKNAAHVRS